MNSTVPRILIAATLLILIGSAYTVKQNHPQAAFMPAETVNLAFFYKPPQESDPATIVGNFNTVILTHGDENYRKKLVANGFASRIPQYFRFDAIQNPGSCTASTNNNQAAYEIGDFCSISKYHPDWFLLDAAGTPIPTSPGSSYYHMDPGNAGWRKFFLTRVIENQKEYGWSGLFLDNVEASLSMFPDDRQPVKYKDNASYQTAVQGFLKYLDVNYSQKYNKPIIGNIIARANDTIWFNYLQYMDGAMQERWAVAWSETSYLNDTKWMSDMALAEQTQAAGKYIILVAPGKELDADRQKFAFASYLLISKGKAAFRYSNSDSYGQAWLYNNYKLGLGTPLGPRYLKDGVWRRDFASGYVLVDPANHAAEIVVSEISGLP
jgi:hypothetical protein